MPFTALPTEIHVAVLAKLDYESLMRMSETSKHFRDLVKANKSIIKEALIATEEYQIEHHRKNSFTRPGWLASEYYNCYQCFKRLPHRYFNRMDCRGSPEESIPCSVPLAWLRICMTCAYGNRSNGAGHIFYVSQKYGKSTLQWPEEWVFCGKCKLAKRTLHFEEKDQNLPRYGAVCFPCWEVLSKQEREDIREKVASMVVTRRNRFQEDKLFH